REIGYLHTDAEHLGLHRPIEKHLTPIVRGDLNPKIASGHLNLQVSGEVGKAAGSHNFNFIRPCKLHQIDREAQFTRRVKLSSVPSMKISAAIITYNEERNIARVLESLRCCDEIVVIDSGSNDRTVELATKLGARVIDAVWRGFA